MEVEVLKTETLPEAYAKVVTDKAIAELHQQYSGLVINGIEDVKGYEAVDKARKHIKKIRSGIEATRKDLKADSLAYGRKVDEVAKELTSKIEPLENSLMLMITAIDEEKERLLKEEAERLQKEEDARLEGIRKAEEEKQKKIQARQQALNRTGAILYHDGEYDMPGYMLGEIHVSEKYALECDEGEFHKVIREFSVEAEKIKMAKEKEAKELQEKQAAIAETERKQKEEREALEREKAALAQEKRLAAEAKEKEEKEKAETERAHLYLKGEKRFRELQKYGLDLKNGNFTANEEIMQLAEKSDEHYEVLRNDWIKVAEDNKKAAAERAEALKPDIQKLREFAAELKKIKIPSCTTDEGKKIALDAKDRLSDQAADILSLTKNIK